MKKSVKKLSSALNFQREVFLRWSWNINFTEL